MTSVEPYNDISSGAAAAPGEVRRWRAFSLLAIAFLMTVIDLAIVNVALPTIGRGDRTVREYARQERRGGSSHRPPQQPGHEQL